MTKTYNKNSQTRLVAQPQHNANATQTVVRTKPLTETHEPIVIFSRDMLKN